MQLLQRLYPVTAGRITLSGVDVNDIERHHLRRNVGIVLQEPFLYSRTIGENIAIARPDADLSDVYAAARTASVHDVIESFSEGYDTVVGERGVTLSGGQKQRCACARALINHPKIVYADEPTGALDSKSARMLLETFTHMNEQMNATILMVTHDAFSASYCKRILFLKDGKIFHELQKGSKSRKKFLDEILDVLSLTGGDGDAE